MRNAAALLILACALLFLAAPASALAAQQERRVALVIGNGAYPSAPLKNPVNDARDMAAALRSLGFEVISRENASLRQMEDALDQFWTSLKKGGTGLFFFAGHGLQVKGVNYLVPVDARIQVEQDVKSLCLDAGRVLGRMEDAGNGLNLVILDACRNNPFARSWRSADAGLAKMDAPTGTLIAYATAPDSVAADGVGRNGVYTSHLLRFMRAPGLSIENVLKQTRIAVLNETGRKQIPWESSSLTGDFYFAGGGQLASIAPVPAPPAAPKQAPVPQPAPAAPQKAAPQPQAPQQQTMAPAPKQVPPAPAAGEPRAGEIWTEPATGMEFAWVPGGCYRMGSAGGRADEKPVHEVCLDGFWMGRSEVTQGQWLKAMGENPAFFTRAKTGNSLNMPVENVAWNDAKAFASKLGASGAGRFRLPTEAEWEYACRSGGKDETYSGAADPDLVAWHSQSVLGIGGSTRPTATKVPNGLGLYDMSGNVWEWVEDLYDAQAYARPAGRNPVGDSGGPNRVNRGGSWFYGPDKARCAYRDSNPPNYRHYTLGLRLVREQPPSAASQDAPPAAQNDLASRFAGRYAVAPGPDRKPGPLVLEFGVKDGQLVGTPSGGASSARPVSVTDIRLQGGTLSFRYHYKLVVFGIASDGHTDFTGELGGDLSAIPFRFATHDGNTRDGWLVRLPGGK